MRMRWTGARRRGMNVAVPSWTSNSSSVERESSPSRSLAVSLLEVVDGFKRFSASESSFCMQVGSTA